MNKVIGWRLKFYIPNYIDKTKEHVCMCKYLKLNIPGNLDIESFPEYYSAIYNISLGDLIDFPGSIYNVDEESGNIFIPPGTIGNFEEPSRYSIFKSVSRDTIANAIETSYDIIFSSKNPIHRKLPSYAKHSYTFETLNQFLKIKNDDEVLDKLYSMVRMVEITPVDTLVAASTTDNRRKIVKWYIDMI